MLVAMESEPMAGKKKSEVRKHTAMMRIDPTTLDQAKLAASLMRMSLADYASMALARAAAQDISREAKKLAKGGSEGGAK